MAVCDYQNETLKEKVYTRIGKKLLNDINDVQKLKYKDRSAQLRKYIMAGVEADKESLDI